MRKSSQHVDKPLALLVAFLLVGGALVFASAAFGLLARGASGVTSAALNHMLFGIGGGLAALLIAYSIDYRTWRRFAPHLYVAALIVTALVFVPHLGFEHGGGRRWIIIFGTSLQSSEALKIGIVIMGAAYFAAVRTRAQTLTWGLGGFLAIVLPAVVLLVLQPDIGTLGVICISFFVVYFAAGARLRDVAVVACIGVLCLSALVMVKPYMRDRVMTFLNPAQGQLSEGYQIKQSLIAIGSGGLAGRGLGQGVQKFTYLPEAMGDSIFAVAGEELGFLGSSVIILAFLLFALRGLTLAASAPDLFGSLLAIGISTYLAIEAFINIASMLGLAPLTGIPLTFISQGGSAMLVSLGSAGILLNISRHRKISS